MREPESLDERAPIDYSVLRSKVVILDRLE